MKNIYWFSEISKNDVPIAGGKGANLGEMFQVGLPVPNGFIIGSNSYFDFIKTTGIDNILKNTLAGLNAEDEQALNKASDYIKSVIIGTALSNDLRVDIVKAYNKLCGVDLIPSSSQEILVAVRSSATAEDLPEASFAGQQATFVNIKGADSLVEAVRKCWASLFEARAIYYRKLNNFDDLKVGIAVVVQKMVESEKSGVMFSVNPVTGENVIMIEAGFGLGEAVVSGAINPDRYIVDKNSLKISKVNVSRQEVMLVKGKTKDEWIEVPEELQEKQKLSNPEITELAGWGKKIEDHYQFPQDMEWAVEGGKIFIVQSRAVTTLKKTEAFEKENKIEQESSAVEQKENVLIQGFGASPGVGVGVVRVILDVKDLYKLKNNEVLVTKMTTPDFVPAMKRASAIVTDEGGITCHAAIVSRELGVPCIVGTEKATSVLKDGELVTVDARSGVVLEGKIEIEEPQKVEVQTGGGRLVTGTKIYVNLAEPESADKVAAQNVDGVGLLRAEFMIAGFGKHPKKLLKEGKGEEFVDMLAKGLRKFCAAFNPRPIVYRATDFKTNEYRNLEGGAEFEPQEDNPMIGFRGCFRYVKDPEVFNLELEAVKRVRNQGFKNLWLMIPVVRTVHEFKIVKSLVEKSGLFQSHDFKLGIMCEVPSTVILAEEFCKAGADFFSIGSNDLTQLTLGVDRDNPIVADDFDERDESILRSIEHVIKTCHLYGVKVGICGQAPSEYREFAEKLVEFGIDSISVNPDVIDSTRQVVASAEFKVLLDKARK